VLSRRPPCRLNLGIGVEGGCKERLGAGLAGASKIRSTGPAPIISPDFITITRSAKSAHGQVTCDEKTVQAEFAPEPVQELDDLRLIIRRYRCLPENWCGDLPITASGSGTPMLRIRSYAPARPLAPSRARS
jgi:hypothetical protein